MRAGGGRDRCLLGYCAQRNCIMIGLQRQIFKVPTQPLGQLQETYYRARPPPRGPGPVAMAAISAAERALSALSRRARGMRSFHPSPPNRRLVTLNGRTGCGSVVIETNRCAIRIIPFSLSSKRLHRTDDGGF